jgi:ABC-type branched-subunit amino acid transport system ATPase component
VTAPGPPGREYAIAVEGLAKRFTGLTAVSDLTMQLRPGEVVGFLGPDTEAVRAAFDHLADDC